jgi:hypothetical protein
MVNRKSRRSRPALAHSSSGLSFGARLGDGRHQHVAGHRLAQEAIEPGRQDLVSA